MSARAVHTSMCCAVAVPASGAATGAARSCAPRPGEPGGAGPSRLRADAGRPAAAPSRPALLRLAVVGLALLGSSLLGPAPGEASGFAPAPGAAEAQSPGAEPPAMRPGPVLRVGAGGTYASIADAIAAAAPGDTVAVAAGTYREAVVVDRPLALVGEPGAVIDGGGAGTVVLITAPDVVLAGFRIRGSGRSLDLDHSGVLVKGPGAVVRDNVIEDVLHGAFLLGAGGATVAHNVIRGAKAESLSRRGDGIRIWNAAGNTIVDNDIRGVRDGIYIQGADDNTVERNVVRDSRYGLHYMYAGRNAFAENRFEHNQVGASVMMSRRVTLRRNTFAGNAGYVGYGVLLQDAEDVLVEGNRFVGNATGIFMDLTVRGRVVGNLIAGNQIGVNVYPSSEGNTFVGNVFTSNVTDVYTGRGDAVNAWADDAGGNYWSAAGAYDFDGDGIGDAPHRTGSLFTHLAESYPQLRLFLFSPAARALDLAERAFPVFGVPEAVDPKPLARPPAVALASPQWPGEPEAAPEARADAAAGARARVPPPQPEPRTGDAGGSGRSAPGATRSGPASGPGDAGGDQGHPAALATAPRWGAGPLAVAGALLALAGVAGLGAGGRRWRAGRPATRPRRHWLSQRPRRAQRPQAQPLREQP